MYGSFSEYHQVQYFWWSGWPKRPINDAVAMIRLQGKTSLGFKFEEMGII